MNKQYISNNLIKYFILLQIIIFSNSGFAFESNTINAEKLNIPKTVSPKAEFTDKKNQIPIPEGGKAIKGMNIPLTIKEINVYGFEAYKEDGLNILKQSLSTALKLYNDKGKNRKIKNFPKIIKNADGSYKILVRSEAYLSIVYALAQQLTMKYQNDKYFLSRAIVPSQEINETGAKIDICAVEGYLSTAPNVEIKKGGKQLNALQNTIKKRLEGLVNIKPLSFKSFERELLLIRDMSGVNIQTTFQQVPGKKTDTPEQKSNCKTALKNGMGATNLAVAISVKKFSGAVGVDNYGIKATGPNFLRFNFNANSVFRVGDQYTLDTAISSDKNELKNYSLSAQIPLSSSGLKLTMAYRKGDAVPGESFKELEIKNRTTTTEVGLEYPWLRSRKRNLTLNGKIQYQNIETDLLSAPFVRDKIRTLHAKATYDNVDKYNGTNVLSLEVVKGMDRNNATQEASVTSSRPEAKPVFTKYIIDAKRYQKLPWEVGTGSFTWVNALKYQHSNKPLFASEEFELGGRSFGRGFDIGIVSGDKGLGLSTQLDYNFSNAMGKIKLYSFIDHGKIINVDNADKGTDQEKVNLTSAGIGINFEHKKNWYINTELAKPLSISGNREKKGHVYVGIGYRY